jgi:putative hydroxymethylpyrimidine transport system permease protein
LNLIRVIPAKGAMVPPQTRSFSRLVTQVWPPLALLAAAVAAWELGVRLGHVPGYLVPSPGAVAASLHDDAHLLVSATLVTIREVVAGYAIAVVCALAIAVLLHFSTALRRALLPLLLLSQAIPTVLLAPILAILLGYGIEPKLVVVAVVCFFPIVVNAVDGLRSTDPQFLLLMRSLHAGRMATFRRVEVPSAVPAIFSGARIAATYAAVGAVFAEWAGSSAGLGFVILQAEPALDTARIFAAVLVLSAIALALYALVTLTERLVIPWHKEVAARA